MEKYDLIIVGAGPAGIFTAVELLRHGSKKKMLLVEKGKPVEKRHCPKAEVGHCVNCRPTCAITTGFSGAGAFSDGLALVRSLSGAYLVIDTAGATKATLDAGADPAYYTVYGGDTVVMTNGTNSALYSISKGEYLTDFLYKTISEFRNGAAMVRQINRWGLIGTNGKLLTAPTYYYLSYMGDGLYAARSEDGSASAVDANGNIAYRTMSYVGGFNELRYGLSWHGMADGSLIFFKKNGGYFASLKNAENPTLLSENVVRVTQNETTKYINLSTGRTLLAQADSFDLGSGITAKTVHYEKFMGYQSDGTEHGWDVCFPEISGLADAKVQKSINDDIRSFFLKGPSVTAEYEALEGTYGASVEGSVLVVWANCVSGRGAGSSVWNNSLAFDLNTGRQYRLTDLLTGDYILHVNPTGKFVIGGPHGDTGLTGRKIIVDSYGGRGAHGGGAFSGKDSSKVDRSAAYAARYIAKNMVAAGIADEILVELSYAIGIAEPISVFVDTHGAVCSRNPKLADMTDGEIARRIAKLFDLRPAAIVKKFGLKNPIFEATASYGHFGNRPYTRKEKVWEDGREVEREIEFFGWEKLDAVDLIKQEFGL